MITKKTIMVATVALMATGLAGILSSCSDGRAHVAMSVQATVPGGTLPVAASSRGAMDRALAVPVVIAVIAKDGVTKLGDLTLETATLAIKNIQIEMDLAQVDSQEEKDQELNIEFPGPFLVNLLTNAVSPAFPTVDLLPGAYDEIELAIDKLDGTEKDASGAPLAAAGSPMLGRSIYVRGSYTGTINGTGYSALPFSLAYDIDEDFELSGTDPVVGMALTAGNLNPLIIAFRLRQWFDFSKTKTNPGLAIDFNSLALGTLDGVQAIVLHEGASGANGSVREVIEENIEESADYGVDGDGDGILQPDEDDDSVDSNDI